MKTITVSFCQDEGETEIYVCNPYRVDDGYEITIGGFRGEIDLKLEGLPPDDSILTIPIEFDSIKIEIEKPEKEIGTNQKALDKIAKCITEAFKVKKDEK